MIEGKYIAGGFSDAGPVLRCCKCGDYWTKYSTLPSGRPFCVPCINHFRKEVAHLNDLIEWASGIDGCD